MATILQWPDNSAKGVRCREFQLYVYEKRAPIIFKPKALLLHNKMALQYTDSLITFLIIFTIFCKWPLTTASLLMEVSRGFHFWQPAPRLNNAPWLAQPRNPASPHAKEQVPVTLTYQWKVKSQRGKNMLYKTLGEQRWPRILTLPKTHERCWELLHMRLMTDHW